MSDGNPRPPGAKKVHLSTPTPAEESDSESITKFLLDACSDKIPKPEGEAGRPGRGGYNLEVQLGLEPRSFKTLKVCVHYHSN